MPKPLQKLATTAFMLLFGLCLGAANGCDEVDESIKTNPSTPQVGTTEATPIMDAAKLDYMSFLAKIPVGMESHYGFSSRDDFNKVTLDKPYRVHTITKDTILENRPFTASTMKKTKQWRVPLLVDSQYVALLTVEQTSNGYKVVKLGAAELARTLQNLDKSNLVSPNEGERFLLRIHYLHMDFLGFENNDTQTDNTKFYPISGLSSELLPKGTGTTIEGDALIRILNESATRRKQ